MIYLASPYSSPDDLVRKTRFLIAEQVCAILLNQGVFVYSPIVHCHELSARHQLPTSFEFWRGYNFDMLRRADLISILAIPGWRESEGVSAELEMARLIGMPITYINELGEKVNENYQYRGTNTRLNSGDGW